MLPRHFQSTHAHYSRSPTFSINTRTQFMFPDTISPHTHTVHVPRHPQSTHAHCSCSPTPSVHTLAHSSYSPTLSVHTLTPNNYLHPTHIPCAVLFLSVTPLITPLVTAQTSRPYTAGRPDCRKASPRPVESLPVRNDA